MIFTATTTDLLAQYDKVVDYAFELCTNFEESEEWQAYPFADFTLTHDANSPAVLRITLLNDDLDMSDECSTTNRSQLLANARLTCTIGAESETLFQGRVWRVEPQDYGFALVCQDWLALIHECECEVSLAPDETSEVATRALSLVAGGAFGSVYGFNWTGAGDPAFNAGGTARRSWAPGDIRLYYDVAATEEVPPKHYALNLTGGTATILEDTSGNLYYAAGVRCYIEGTLDWSAVFQAALQYPKASGGIGAVAGELDLPDLGLDVAGPLYYRGKVGGLFKQILSRQQANLRLWYSSRSGKYTLRIIEQAEPESEDWELQHAVSIAQLRDVRELYSRVVVSGLSERPRNALTEGGTTITPRAGEGTWFAWDGLNVGGDSTFAVVGPNLWDGDTNMGAAVHNLPASENGGSDKYDSWYDFIKVDLGSVQRLSRVRATLPGSRNVNASAGHQGKFWPGLRILGSVDDSDYRLLSPLLCGRYPPSEQLEARGKELLYPKLRYLKVYCGAYKHGFDNEADPSIGLAELEVYTAEEYRVIKEIDGNASPPSSYSYTGGGTWSRNHPDIWTRLGERHRTRFADLAGEINEYLAHDYALDLLAESVRLFQQVSYRAVCDPRVALYDTVAVNDELNGDVGSILVERVVLRPGGTEISGTNYLAEALGNE